jgi:hypothetical protein
VVEEDVRRVSVGLDLLSGAAGAVFVAIITILYTELQDARQQARARMGYARLLDAEIEAHEPVVGELRTYQDRFLMSLSETSYVPPTIKVWPEISAKLAALIEAEDFALLNKYYRELQVLVDLKEKRALAAERGEPIGEYLSRMEGLTQEARRLLSKYARFER